MKRIFLTGINGFLGRHVALKLKEQGCQVIGLIRGEEPHDLRGSSIDYCRGDLLEPGTYREALGECNMVIHTAAIASFGLNKPEDYYRVNYEGTKMLVECAEKNGISRFIHAGTRGTLGVAGLPAQSDESCQKVMIERADDYVKSKLMAEKAVLQCSNGGKMFCMVLSPTALIGAGDDKPTPVGRIILSFLQGRIGVYMNGGLNLIDVDDAAQAFVAALDRGKNGQTYILGNSNIPLYELFKQLSLISSTPVPKIKIPFILAYGVSYLIEALSKISGRPPFVTPHKVVSLFNDYSYCSSRRAVQELDLPQTPLKDTLGKIVEWYKNNESCLN